MVQIINLEYTIKTELNLKKKLKFLNENYFDDEGNHLLKGKIIFVCLK